MRIINYGVNMYSENKHILSLAINMGIPNKPFK